MIPSVQTHSTARPPGAPAKAAPLPLAELQARIRRELVELPHLDGLRNFNHLNLESVAGQFAGAREEAVILDVGASIHGFALEKADALGFKEYIGIDLDVRRQWGTQRLEVASGARVHQLCQMDAHRLWFEDGSIDVVLCLSGFEHYLFPELVLGEIRRVLKPGGIALISYEPIWTSSYGHHLHHFGLTFEQVPPWSHLILGKNQMREVLATKRWPEHCAVNRAQALEWIYDGREINRRDCRFHRGVFAALEDTQVRWLQPHLDESETARAAVDYVASLLPYTREELLTRGYSCCFRK